MNLRNTFTPVRMRAALLALAVAGLVTLPGCATRGSRYAAPAVPLPSQFKHSLPSTPSAADGTADDGAAVTPPPLDARQLREWWRLLGDPVLDALVDRALANNPDLHIATARMEQGRARAHQAHAGQYPLVGLGYQGILQKPNGGSVGQINTSGTSTYHVLQLSMSLNVDAWGEHSALAESATAQLWRMRFQRDDARRTVVANTVSLYIDYLSLNDRIRIAHQTEQVLHGMLDSVKGRMEGGDATATDYEQQRAAVHSVAATIPVLELQRANAENALALLLGVPASALSLPADRGMSALSFPHAMPGIPTQLLLNRPDVHAAEMRLRSANADIEVARARLLPSLDLTAQAGYGAQWLSQLISPSGFYWNAIASVSATLFDHGARTDEVDFTRAVDEELVEAYVQSIYSAIRETEDAIAAIHYNTLRLESQQLADEAAGNAWRNTTEAYGAGAIDYLTLLDTQRTYFSNQDTLQGVVRDRYKGLVTLFAALGGGTTVDASDSGGDQGSDVASTGDSGPRLAAATTLGSPRADDGAWLVGMAGLQDDEGVASVRRDLDQRFAEVMQGRRVIARRVGELGDDSPLHTAWYRVFVGGFAAQDEADGFCRALSEQMQRCQVVAAGDATDHQDAPHAAPAAVPAE